MHVECPTAMADTLREMSIDADVDLPRRALRHESQRRLPLREMKGLVCEKFHRTTMLIRNEWIIASGTLFAPYHRP